jgi:hypothetical protein
MSETRRIGGEGTYVSDFLRKHAERNAKRYGYPCVIYSGLEILFILSGGIVMICIHTTNNLVLRLSENGHPRKIGSIDRIKQFRNNLGLRVIKVAVEGQQEERLESTNLRMRLGRVKNITEEKIQRRAAQVSI